ncbi:hypothetical protein ACH4SK_30790 [Streptomyces inhibens]
MDQAHVLPALVPTIDNYWLVDPGPHSDRYGFAFTLDLDRTDTSLTHTCT